MAESEKFTLEVDVKASGAVKELENVEKAANKAEEGLEGLKDTGEVSGNALVSSLKRLAGTFGLVLSAGAVVSFIKRVSEANLLLGQMAVRSGQSEKSIRAMQNQFKALGYSASEANSIVDDLAGSFAALKFGGELTGITKAFTDLGVSVIDAQGKARDLYDMAIEAGEFALGFTGGDRESAMQLMMSRGISPALADMATRSDAREQAESLKRQAAASREMAASTAKLSGAMTEMENALTDSVLKINENFGLFDGLGNAVSAMVPAVSALTDVILQIGKIFTSLKNIAQAAFAPVLEKFKEFGESVDKKIKSGEDTGILGYFAGVGETGNTDYQYDADQVRKEARGSSANAKGGISNTDRATLDLIGRGEGSYNSVNLGKAKGGGAGTRNLVNMTIGDVLQSQKNKDFNAAGKYQFIPATLRRATRLAGLKESDLFNEENQDRLAMALMNSLPAVKNYIEGRNNNLNGAIKAIATQWASVANPDTGLSYWHGTQGNRASISGAEMGARLKGMREEYLKNGRNATYAEASKTPNVIMPRVQPAAYSVAPATTKVSQSSPTVTQNITVYAPSTEASEIVAEIRKRTQNIGALTSVFI
jgi:hypothetical protein